MKIIKNKFYNNEQLKTWLLIVGLFVFWPISIYYFSDFLTSSFGKKGCLISSGGLVWLHIGLLLIIPLARTISWKITIIIVGVFIAISSAEFAFHGMFGSNLEVLVLYNTYNAFYLSAVKALVERRFRYSKACEKRPPSNNKIFSALVDFISAIGYAAVGFTTLFVGMFFVFNCF